MASLYDAARDSKNVADIWDDTALIEQYERQIKIAYDAADSEQEESPGPSSKLVAGAKCMALFEHDGMYYSATVKSIGSDGRVVVHFDEYDNEEATLNADEVCTMAAFEADDDCMETSTHRPESSTANVTANVDASVPAPSMPPPVPLHILQARLPQNTSIDEDLSAMLMSWYMCGYHTGFYEGRSGKAPPQGEKK